MSKAVKVNAVIVTYNRLECLTRLLNALEGQTYPVDTIILVNNHSTDGTHKSLLQGGYIDDVSDGGTSVREHGGVRYYYFLSAENTGGSGGFAKGIELALTQTADYVWIMDDDVCPEPDCLAKMIGEIEDGVVALVPNRTDENYDEYVCTDIDLRSAGKFNMWRRQTHVKHPLTEPYYYVKGFTFEGPMIAYETIKKVGLPCAEFVILCDDLDYAMRVGQHGKLKQVTAAILHRQLASRQSPKGPVFSWKTFYSVRNNVLMQRKYCETFRAKYISPILMWNWWFLLLVYKRSLKDIKHLNRAVREGLHDVYGMTVRAGEF